MCFKCDNGDIIGCLNSAVQWCPFWTKFIIDVHNVPKDVMLLLSEFEPIFERIHDISPLFSKGVYLSYAISIPLYYGGETEAIMARINTAEFEEVEKRREEQGFSLQQAYLIGRLDTEIRIKRRRIE